MCIRVNYLRGLRHRDYLPLLAQPTHTRRIVALVQIFQFDIFQSLVLSRRYDDTHFSFCDILPRRIAVKRHSMSNRANGTFVQREGGRAGTKPKLYHGSVILGLTLDGESRFCLRSIQFERSELQILTDCPRAYYRTLPARNIGRNCCFRTDSARSDDFGTRSFFFPFFSFFRSRRETFHSAKIYSKFRRSISRSKDPKFLEIAGLTTSSSTRDRSYLVLEQI